MEPQCRWTPSFHLKIWQNAKENKNLNRSLTLFQCIKISSYYVGALLTLGVTHTYTFCFKFPTNMNHIYNHLYSYDKQGLVVGFFLNRLWWKGNFDLLTFVWISTNYEHLEFKNKISERFHSYITNASTMY